MTGRIIAIEGGDGAGKGTLSKALCDRLRASGRRATLVSFPRYQSTLGGRAIGDFLAHRAPAPEDPRAIAVFYAVDRFESKAYLKQLLEENDFLIIDRYIGSNVAYQSAKVPAEDRQLMVDWIVALELAVFNLPPPDLSIFLNMPVAIARELIARKDQRAYTDCVLDRHEEDLSLQKRVVETYQWLAARKVMSSWLTIDPVREQALRTPYDLVDEAMTCLRRHFDLALPALSSASRLLRESA